MLTRRWFRGILILKVYRRSYPASLSRFCKSRTYLPYGKVTGLAIAKSQWFDGNIQKIVSVAAGTASSYFSINSWKIWWWTNEEGDRFDCIRPAVFDARAFVVPIQDITNYFLWRQLDATRNSVQMLARSMFSHKECDNKNVIQLKEMCAGAGRPWDELPVYQRQGFCILRDPAAELYPKWIRDNNIPVFSQDRNYIDRLFEAK